MLAANAARWAAGPLASSSGLSAWLAAGGSSAATAATTTCSAAAAATAHSLHGQQRGLSSTSAAADAAEASTAAGGGAAASQPAAADGSSALQALADLPPEQRRAAAALRTALVPPLRAAADAALLHTLGVAYRDLVVSADLMHKKDVLGIPRPLTDDPPPASSATAAGGAGTDAAAAAPSRTQLFYPVRDLTRLPDPPDCGMLSHLRGRYMGSAFCYMQVLPNHLEVSYQTGSAFMLWPPMEVYSPFYIDYEMAARAIPNIRQRLGRSGTRRRKKQRRVVVSTKATGLMPRAV